MAMVDADGTCILTLRLRLLGLRVGGHLAVSLHSSNEPGVHMSQGLATIMAIAT